MRYNYCSVQGCGKSTKLKKTRPDFTLHRFPIKNKELCAEWIKRCNIRTLTSPESAVVCCDHFLPDDYLRDLMNELLNLPLRKRLKPEAVPSVFMDNDDEDVLTRKSKKDLLLTRCLICGIDPDSTKQSNTAASTPIRKSKRFFRGSNSAPVLVTPIPTRTDKKKISKNMAEIYLKTKQKEVFQAWNESCAYSVWKVLDVDEMFQNCFRNANYCKSCLQLTRDIDFSLKALARLQEQIQRSREEVVNLLKTNLGGLQSEFDAECFTFGSGKFHGLNSYSQIIKSLCEALAIPIPPGDLSVPQIVKVVSTSKDQAGSSKRSTDLSNSLSQTQQGFIRNDLPPVDVSEILSASLQQKQRSPPPSPPAPPVQLQPTTPRYFILVPPGVIPRPSAPAPVVVEPNEPGPQCDFVKRLRKQIYMTTPAQKRKLAEAKARLVAKYSRTAFNKNVNHIAEDESAGGYSDDYEDDEIQFVAELPPEANSKPQPPLINLEDDDQTLPITIYPKGSAPTKIQQIKYTPRILRKDPKFMVEKVKKIKPPRKPPAEKLFCTYENCSFKTFKETVLESHVLRIHTKCCQNCGRTFGSHNILRVHNSRCGKEPTIPCDQEGCTRLFYSNRLKNKHYEKIHEEQNKFNSCPTCNLRFLKEQEGELAKHVQLHEAKKAENLPLACVIEGCETILYCTLDLKRHVKLHHDNTVLRCPDCDAVYKSQYSLRTHRRMRHTERTRKCRQPGCTFVTTLLSDLKGGVCASCRSVPKFQCNSCSKSYALKFYLDKHVRRVHEGRTIFPNTFKCSYANCERIFKNPSKFRYHEQQHADYRPYLCHQCSSAFKTEKGLHQHLNNHRRVPKPRTNPDGSRKIRKRSQACRPRKKRRTKEEMAAARALLNSIEYINSTN